MVLLLGALLSLGAWAQEPLASVPDPFQRFDPASPFSINYADLDVLLKMMVVDVGRSNRDKADPTQAKVGTRMKMSVNRSTISEGNRFYFEEFKGNEDNQKLLLTMRSSLEQIPSDVPLEYLSRNEQLAYWLNLYNATLLSEIVKVYPTRSLKSLLTGKKSILAQKLLTVAGVPLSLNDIQFTILRQNYANDPLIMYGFYQGIIGGPNIRKRAYTGENVYRLLEENAVEFVNSNRGTFAESDTVFRVSRLYERNAAYFRDFESDLTEHLLKYVEGEERTQLAARPRIKANIDDWTVTDVYGTYRDIGTTSSTSTAALLDAVQSVSGGGESGNTPISGNLSAASSQVQAKAPELGRFSPEMLDYLHEIKEKEAMTNLTKGNVTVEELGTAEEQQRQKEREQEKDPQDQ
jgi:hypothetical protein